MLSTNTVSKKDAVFTIEKARELHKRILNTEASNELTVEDIASKIGAFRQSQIEEREAKENSDEIIEIKHQLDRFPFVFPTPKFTSKKSLGIYCDFMAELKALCVKYISIINNLK